MAKRPDKKEIAQMVVMSKMGESNRSIAGNLGRSHHTVKKYTASDVYMNDAEIKKLVALIIEKEREDLTLLGGKARARLHELLDGGKTKAIETTAIMDRTFQQRRLLENASTQNVDFRSLVEHIKDNIDKAEAELAELTKEHGEDDET